MTTPLALFLERVRAAAAPLDEPDTLALLEALHPAGTARLRLLLVGTAGVGRFSLANVLLGQPDLLPASPLPRLPLSTQLVYGTPASVEIASDDGIVTALLPEDLRTFLTQPAAEAAHARSLTVHTPAELLKLCTLRIETLSAGRSAHDWQAVLAQTDYVLLVLNATALLSGQERQFVRDVVQPTFGLERVAVIINQMDLVDPAERDEVRTQVRAFLGRFESQPALLDLSAQQALNAAASGQADPGAAALWRLVHEDLLARQRTLKSATQHHLATLAFATLRESVERQHALSTASAAELRTLLGRLDPESDWLRQRVARQQQRIDAFINTLLKEESLREIEAFSRALGEHLPSEVMRIADVTTIKRHLPGYLEALWGQFFTTHLAPLRARLADEVQAIHARIADDLRDLADEAAPDLPPVLRHFDPTPARMQAFMMPSRGKHAAGTAATWMQAGGLAMVFMSLPASLALIGGGQAVRMLFQRSLVEADKRAIVRSLGETQYDLERQLKHQVSGQFARLTSELHTAIVQTYEQRIADLRRQMEAELARQQAVQARRAQLEALRNETVPALEEQLAELTNAPQGAAAV